MMSAHPELASHPAIPGRLAKVLPEYLARVPLYRHYPRLAPENPVPTTAFLESLPLITKRDIGGNFPANFLENGADLQRLVEAGKIELEHTSGTSEARTPLLLPAGWWIRQEARTLRLNKTVAAMLDGKTAPRRVTINSPMCSNEISYATVPSRDDRTIGNALFLSLSRYPFLWGDKDVARMISEAADWGPLFLDVDPVYGVVFARHCERRGIRFPSLKFIIASYSFVSLVHRNILERVFRVPVFDLYGSTETGHLMMEVENGLMAPSPETAFLEVIRKDECGVGDLVVTTLDNECMPLVRYQIGDLVEAFSTPEGPRYRVQGRTLDTFLLENNQRLTTLQVDNAFAGIPGISQYQLQERRSGTWLLRWVTDALSPTQASLHQLQTRLAELTGARVELQQTDTLIPETSGKFRLTCPLRRAGA